MADASVIGEVLKAFKIALNAHDRENPSHTAHGIGMAFFDLDRLGFEDGEEIFPGITISSDNGGTGNFRVLCDGQHDNAEEEEAQEDVEAVARDLVPVRVGGGRDDGERPEPLRPEHL
ncbi:MAG: hypothetical protein PGN13_10840 [Patulibacter minatonensis]